MSDIPAGWQPDPRGRHEYRYWDGTQWTDHVSDQGAVSEDPVSDDSAPAAAETPATETPAAADPAPTEIQDTPVAAEPEPVVAEPDPVVAEPEPVVVEPDPVVAEPVIAEPVIAEPVAEEPAPEPVATPEPVVTEPAPTTATTAASSGPPTSGATASPTAPSTAQSDAKAAAQDMLSSKSPELGTILSAVVPGSGHFYLGKDNAVPVGVGLLVATVVALVLSYMSFVMFLIGFLLWAGAVAFALNDIRGSVKGIENVSLPPATVGILLIGAGALLVISLLLPYYHIKLDAGAFGSAGGSLSGFRSFGIIDIILLVVGVAAIVGGAASLGLGPVTTAELPRQLPIAIAVGGAIAVVLILFRMFIHPFEDTGDGVKIGRAFGIWFGLWASMVLVIANAGVLRSLSNRN
jgi:hypothetical protein